MPSKERRARKLGIPLGELVDSRGKHGNHPKGSQHPRWNDGEIISSHGYVKVRVPKTHHLADPNGYAYQHQVVAEAILGRRLESNEVVHHRNLNKRDNRPENLEVMERGDHWHGRGRDSKTGRFIAA